VISHSAVGAGTVVGSELFNMLVIIGGVCLVTPIPLALDWRPLVREVTFFTLSLIGILATLQDSQVHWYEAAVLLSGYVGYVLVCSFYPKIIQLFCPMAEGPGGEGDEFRLEAIMDAMDNGDLAVDEGLRDTLRQSMTFSKEKLNGGAFGMDYGDVIMHGFIHKKSEFYSKVRNSKQMWQKRWMVLDDDKLYYQKKNGEDRMLISSPIAWAKAWVRFTDKTEFTVSYPGNELVFQAQVPTLTRKWVAALGSRIEHFRSHAGSPSQIDLVEDAHDDDDDEEVHNILHFPSHGLGAQAFFLFSFPLLLIFRCTIIDVRKKKLMNYFPVTILTTVVWLAVMAEGMMRGADQSGCILGVSESVMGLTVAAAGTSLPNLFASLIVAKQGLVRLRRLLCVWRVLRGTLMCYICVPGEHVRFECFWL
jgi:Ca2+/Na+ antiporter